MNALQLLLVCLAGWLNRNQQSIIEYLREEVRVLKEQLGKKPRFSDDQRRRLAGKARILSSCADSSLVITVLATKLLPENHHVLLAFRENSPVIIQELVPITQRAVEIRPVSELSAAAGGRPEYSGREDRMLPDPRSSHR